MQVTVSTLLLLGTVLFTFAISVSGLNCYQCDSNVDLECNEEFDGDSTQLRPLSCDHIHEARFCTKTTGMYAGRIGTVRNCSSRDLGDYCSYIDRPGDIRYTRSCIFTCSRDGCNAGPAVGFSIWLTTAAFAFTAFLLVAFSRH